MEKSKKELLTIDKYFALGFDADHCLVRYNLPEFFAQCYRCIVKVLVSQFSYPSEMLEFGTKEKHFIFNGLIVDYKTAFIIKLGENKVILRAYYGYDRVSQEELEKIYGSPPKFEVFDPYSCAHEDYQCCISFFECFFTPILAHMIACKKKTHHLEQIDARQIYKDAHKALDIADHDFDIELAENIDKIIYKQDRMKGILKDLRKRGKIIFLVSNGPPSYLSIVMKQSYGEDWASLFDFTVLSSSKPQFFYSSEKPFYGIDEKGVTMRDQVIEKLERFGIHAGGNARVLEENLNDISEGKTGRVAFFGDNYSTDILAAEKMENWDGVCIIEELEGLGFGEGFGDSYWGHWQYEDTEKGRIETFWYSYMRKNVAKCVPFVDSKEMIQFFEGSEEKNEEKT